MSDEQNRVVPSHQYSDVVAMVLMVYSIPKIIEDVEALVVFPGLGEDWRLKDAIDEWSDSNGTFFLIAGINQNEKTFKLLNTVNLMQYPFFLESMDCVESQVLAANTKEQAEWICERVIALGIRSLALFASPFHCLRAYLTLLKTFIAHGKSDIILIPAPTPISPSRLIPENQMSAWDLVPGEVERIIRYQEKGDVVTREELAHYLGWLWEQPLVREMEVQ